MLPRILQHKKRSTIDHTRKKPSTLVDDYHAIRKTSIDNRKGSRMTNADSPRSLNNSRWVLHTPPEHIVSSAGADSLDAQQLITNIAESNDIPHCYPNFWWLRSRASRAAPTSLKQWQEVSRNWLNPALDQLYDPYLITNMNIAVERISAAITNRERIRIVTDYDVDGTTSSLILQSAIRLMGHPAQQIDYHIPDRFDEGYGFSVRAAENSHFRWRSINYHSRHRCKRPCRC